MDWKGTEVGIHQQNGSDRCLEGKATWHEDVSCLAQSQGALAFVEFYLSYFLPITLPPHTRSNFLP